MDIQWWQILLLTLYAGYQILDSITISSSMDSPVFAGFISGLIMGDMVTGLIIGGSMQLTILGVGTFGGASRIDANSGTVIATAFSIGVGMDPQVAIAAIAVPVASLLIQTDILGRFTNTYFLHRIDTNIEKLNFKGITFNYLMGIVPWSLSRMIPVFLALAFGGGVVETAVNFMNEHLEWLSNGLATAGALLPAVGFAILLRYLPVKRHIAYLILGFILTALFATLYTNIISLGTAMTGVSKDFAQTFNSLPMLAITFVGLAFAILEYKRSTSKTVAVAENHSNMIDEGGEIDDDEL
ncbi:PTS mannose/fructose/sorbose/N-acetylgalactosamine transporter subunit IIC [Listeria ilorinensis]|uniref:PTS mannose/fructose/sorbose/N-acetylgalactosamine transporter subunit IIC n=1 Tax=Listeria ilorinensis TaxID=2867439 RepID=UPI001EF5ABE0|nr:PTS sugar transporter subunit IIC [Listeria ilorinensis]